MARSTRAFAPSPVLPSSVDPASKATTAAPSIESLAFQAGDEADNLRDVHNAYAGLEKLLARFGSTDREEIQATRTELSSLVRLVNVELERRIDLVGAAIQSVHAALSQGSAQ